MPSYQGELKIGICPPSRILPIINQPSILGICFSLSFRNGGIFESSAQISVGVLWHQTRHCIAAPDHVGIQFVHSNAISPSHHRSSIQSQSPIQLPYSMPVIPHVDHLAYVILNFENKWNTAWILVSNNNSI